MNNIKNIYQHAGKCDDQQNLKDIIDADMVSTPEGVTYNSPNAPMTLVALVLFGDVPKWSGQGHFEDTSGTCPGCIRDMSGRGHIFRQVWKRT